MVSTHHWSNLLSPSNWEHLFIETKCRANLCQPYERCVYSGRTRPVCIVCQYSPRFYAHSGECSMNIATCGDDGYLYKNYCALLRGQCDKNRYINIIDYQTCPKKLNVPRKRNWCPHWHRSLLCRRFQNEMRNELFTAQWFSRYAHTYTLVDINQKSHWRKDLVKLSVPRNRWRLSTLFVLSLSLIYCRSCVFSLLLRSLPGEYIYIHTHTNLPIRVLLVPFLFPPSFSFTVIEILPI